MSEEDAFLDGIAANRADRTRLLVFADWLADRGDPREEFVRLHARLLDMEGIEPEFEEFEKRWEGWTACGDGPDCLPRAAGKLSDRWLDALCRVSATDDIERYLFGDEVLWATATATRLEFDLHAHKDSRETPTTVLYYGQATRIASSREFLVSTVLRDIRADEWFDTHTSVRFCAPITRGSFWRRWRECLAELLAPPSLPLLSPDNLFLGGQILSTGWSNWAIIGVHQHDYFALFRSVTD